MSKFAYKFSNLYGAVYRQGNLVFTEDGDSVISPVGNRLSHFDLKNNKSCTFPLENRKNIRRFAVSPNGVILISVDEDGRALIVNLRKKTVLHHFNFKERVYDLSYSPDGRYVVVTHGRQVQVWHAPGQARDCAPLSLYRSFPGQYDSTLCLDWSDDSRFFAVGSRDMSCRVFSVRAVPRFHYVTLAAHRSAVRSCFFRPQSLSVYTVAKDGAVGVWECSLSLPEMKSHIREQSRLRQRRRRRREREEGKREGEERRGGLDDVGNDGSGVSEDEEEKEEEEGEEEEEEERDVSDMEGSEEEEEEGKTQQDTDSPPEEEPGGGGRSRTGNICSWSLARKHLYPQEYGRVTCSAMHKPSQLLIAGFTSGVFALHEMPDFNPIHTLSISQQKISSVAVNSTGEWLAFGCSSLGQLLVWEWQSETYILKQQSHSCDINSLAYSPDGQTIATGGDDGQVKLWSTATGFCFVTFSEHTAAVSSVVFSSRDKVVLTASLDGTVRAFDLHRYRNFRTFASPRPVQFSCLTLDPSGEVVCAGSHDTFEVYVWSMQTGRLLELLAGHEAPVSCLSFCPSRALLVSGSWDKTVRLWDVFESKGAAETYQLTADVLTLAFRPDGAQLAVAGLDAQITFWETASSTQVGSIEGRHDLEIGRHTNDKVTAKTLSSTAYFSSLCYTVDGQNILAGGRSKFICLYHVAQQVLLRKFQVSRNLSFDGMQRFLGGQRMTEAGALDLISEDEEEEDVVGDMKLPGVVRGDMSSRRTRPEIRVKSIQFSPTGQSWAAVTTEGLLVYSLDTGLLFDPLDLTEEVTPEAVRLAVSQRQFSVALAMSLRLSDWELVASVVEAVPSANVQLTVQRFPTAYIEKFMDFLADRLDHSPHLQFHLQWCREILVQYGPLLKKSSMALLASLKNLQKSVAQRQSDIGQIVDHNTYMLQYAVSQAQLTSTKMMSS